MGFVPVIAPMLTIRPLPAKLPASIDAIVLTSRNALSSLPPALYGTTLFAVGGATAAAARARGFVDVRDADGDAAALRGLLRTGLPNAASVLLPTARRQGGDLARGLRDDGRTVHRRAVYEAVPARDLPAAAREALAEGLHAALFFSAATARAFAEAIGLAQLEGSLKTADACAIGAPAGVALGALPWRRVRVAARPTQDDLLALLR